MPTFLLPGTLMRLYPLGIIWPFMSIWEDKNHKSRRMMDHLKNLAGDYGPGRPNRVRVETISSPYLESQIRALVGFELRITEVHASAKLSQNRDDENYRTILQKLEESSRQMEQALAEEMKKRRKTV